MPTTFWLQLGRLPELSLKETSNIFPNSLVTLLCNDLYTIDVEDEAHFDEQLNKSGGIIKVIKSLDTVEQTIEAVTQKITELLEHQESRHFAISYTSSNNQNPFTIDLHELKDQLKAKSVSRRFVDSTSHGVSAAVLLHQNVIEYMIVFQEGQCLIGRSYWVQNIDQWTKRDRMKPYRDHKKGMLPPKLARMMVNFLTPELQQKKDKILFDPFCGTSTVLMEAMLMDWQVIGSDISADTIHKTGENIHWFQKEYQKENIPVKLFIQDAVKVDLHSIGKKVDAIVTEPFLGKQQPSETQLPNIYRGLEKMYLGIFKQFRHLLNPGGEIVIVTPFTKTSKHSYSLEKIIDKLPDLGYTIISGPLFYQREQTIVQRAIYHIKLNS